MKNLNRSMLCSYISQTSDYEDYPMHYPDKDSEILRKEFIRNAASVYGQDPNKFAALANAVEELLRNHPPASVGFDKDKVKV